MIYHDNIKFKKAGVAIFQSKENYRDKEGHFIIIRRVSIPRRHTILNVYVPNNRTSKYIKEKLIVL